MTPIDDVGLFALFEAPPEPAPSPAYPARPYLVTPAEEGRLERIRTEQFEGRAGDPLDSGATTQSQEDLMPDEPRLIGTYHRRPLERLATEMGFGPSPIEDHILSPIGSKIEALAPPDRTVLEMLWGLTGGPEVDDEKVAAVLSLSAVDVASVWNRFMRPYVRQLDKQRPPRRRIDHTSWDPRKRFSGPPPEEFRQKGVYLFRQMPQSIFKIGFSTNVGNRLQLLRAGNPNKMEVLFIIPGADRAVEAELLWQARPLRISREWFAGSYLLFNLFLKRNAVLHAEPEFRELCALDQRIWTLVFDSWLVGDDGKNQSFSANDYWYGRHEGGGLKRVVLQMVGWEARDSDPRLQTSRALDIVAEHVYDWLPWDRYDE